MRGGTYSSFVKSVSPFDWPKIHGPRNLTHMQSELFFVGAHWLCDIPEKSRFYFLDFECRPTPLYHNSINKGSFGTVCCFWPATARLFFQSFNISQVAAIGLYLMSLEPRQNSRSAVFSFDYRALFCFASSLSDQWPHPILVRRLHNAVWMFSQRSQRDLELQPDPLSCQRCWML